MRKKSFSLKLLVIPLFLAGVIYLLISGISSNSIYFLNVAEALTLPDNQVQSARLFGTVKAGENDSFREDGRIKFMIEDKDNADVTLWVIYNGIMPDNFKPGAEVIVEGAFSPGKKHFDASSVMTKCPSKYEKSNRV